MNHNIDIEYIMQVGRKNKHKLEMGFITCCPVCDTVLTNSNAQYAHYMSQGKQSRKKNSDRIIDHTFNGAYVCSLKCNNDIQIDRQPELIKSLTRDIEEELNGNKKR